jgi:hypothetical protein
MAALFHFCFELIKIAILSSAYAAIILLIIMLFDKLTKRKIISRLFVNKKRIWKVLIYTIYAILFIFMFTYWGNHGLGDDSYIPIGHNKVVNQSDEFNYLENDSGKQLNIKDFAVVKDNLYAEVQNDPKYNYVIWDLKSDQWRFYNNQTSLEKAIGKSIFFKDFRIYYKDYWNGWRFWLLP